MRLLFINYEYPPLGGGAGNAAANLAREAAALGHRVLVLTTAFGDLPRLEEAGGLTVRRVRAPRARADRCRPHEMLGFMLAACPAAIGALRRFRPEGTVAFFGLPGGPPAWLLKLLGGVPYVVSLRGGDVPGFQPYDLRLMHALTRPVITFLWRRALAVVANSDGLRDLALASAPELAIPVIPNGVDPVRFAPAEGRPAGGPVRLLFVGRLARQKGLDVLLDALAGLDSRADWTLDVAGDGPIRPELEERARRLSLAERVRFLGWRERQDLPELYRRADLFVFPSRDEGMPNAVLEAMASGLPVAASRISGNEELTRHGETGLLVPPDDAPALGAALGELLADPARRLTMGAAGRRLVEREYSWRRAAERYVELFRGRGGR